MTLKNFEGCTLNLHVPTKTKYDLIKKCGKKIMEEISVYGNTSLLLFVE
jgi:hypothetical protein